MPVKGTEVVVCVANTMAQGSEYFEAAVVDSNYIVEKAEVDVVMVNRIAACSVTTHMIAGCIWCC